VNVGATSFGYVSVGHGCVDRMQLTWRRNLCWPLGVAVAVALLGWGTLLGGGSSTLVETLLGALPFGDKVGHFGLYGAITFGLAMMTRTQRNAMGVATAVMVVGVADEVRQLLYPSRSFTVSDLAANLIGVSLGLGAAMLVRRHLPRMSASRDVTVN